MRITRMRFAAALCTAGLLLAGCGGGGWPSAAGPVGTPSAPPPPAPTTAAATGTPAPAPSTAQESGEGRCTDAELDAGVGTTTGEAGQRHTTVVWTNTSSRPCTTAGFGGVDLRGPADPTFGPSYSLPRSAEQASPVRLDPGGTAHTVITWLPGGDWTPTELVVTPPDETTSTVLQWPGAAVQRQDGATRPGSYIGPVTAGTG
ncbi:MULTISPECIES: DUF4232 domain-containing protein [Pseudonocardia]|nr:MULTISPECIES: DUF4232 domain-containing protein [Pseudonocardia]